MPKPAAASTSAKRKTREPDDRPKAVSKKAKQTKQQPSKGKGKGKGKGKAREMDDEAAGEPSKQGGRAPGAHNYTPPELRYYFKVLKKMLPVSPTGWDACGAIYNTWAEKHGFPQRAAKALRTKFESVSTHGHPVLHQLTIMSSRSAR